MALLNFTGNFLIDGFPRNQENIDVWNKVMADVKVTNSFVLYLDCPAKMMEDRVINRGKTSGRSDDNAEAMKKRLATFLTESLPII